MNRRQFLSRTSAFASVVAARAQSKKPPQILLRSSWQSVNIGDIGHTPGTLRFLEQHLPDAKLILWAANTNDAVDAMLMKRFPKLEAYADVSDVGKAAKDWPQLKFIIYQSA